MSDLTLHDTIKKIKTGDKKAFKVLFESLQQGIFNYLFFKSKDMGLSEDLVQEAFLKLWENRRELDEKQSVKAYLYRIANNLFLNHQRHLRVVDHHQSQSAKSRFLETNHPQFLLEEKEFHFKLSTAIAGLPGRTREIFLMSRVDALSNKEISERLDISVKTVESHIGKALTQLGKNIPRHYFRKNK